MLTHFIPKRFIVAFLTFLGTICVYLMRTNLSIALVEMTTDRNVTTDNSTFLRKREFDLDSKQVGFLLSLFSYGYLMAPFGGYLSVRYGGVRMYGLGILLTSMLTLFTPLLINLNFFVYAAARLLEGLFESLTITAFIEVMIQWSPPNELSRMSSLAYAGVSIGGALNFQLSGFVAQHFGWKAVFYVTGCISVVWFIIWWLVVGNTPEDDKFISKAERAYLREERKLMPIKQIKSYPWKQILKCKAVWALANEFFCFAWVYSFLMYCLPIYVKDVHDVDVQEIGFISSIPIFAGAIGLVFGGYTSDYLRARNIFSKSTIHRMNIAIGQLSTVILLIVIGVWGSFVGSIICFCIQRIIFGLADTSYHVIPVDAFGSFAGFIRGINIGAHCLGAILNPTIMGFMITNHSSLEWNFYFIFISAFNLFGLIIFFLFGSTDLQPWAENSDSVSDEKSNGRSTDEK